MLVVLFIISLGVTLITPRILSGGKGSREVAFLQGFLHTLRRASTLAIAKGKVVTFSIEPGQRTYGIEGEKSVPIPLEVEIRGEGGERLGRRFAIYFMPDGSATGAELTIRYGDRTWDLMVNPLLATVSLREVK